MFDRLIGSTGTMADRPEGYGMTKEINDKINSHYDVQSGKMNIEAHKLKYNYI